MTIRVIANPASDPSAPFGAEQRSGFDPQQALAAKAALRSWPVYAPTPLLELPGLARSLGVARLWAKDETLRRPLASFKALGGAYALAEALLDQHQRMHPESPRRDHDALWRGELRDVARTLHVIAATDGNHGRSVAWAARQFGSPCTIFLPGLVSPAREAAIAEFGATIVRVAGTWDDALVEAQAASRSPGAVLIQDSSFPGYTLHCQRIMYGYALMSEEVRDCWSADEAPTHVFLQTGCGGLAAVVAADFWSVLGPARPTLIAVQSKHADALLRSVAAGEMRVAGGAHDTVMVGVACGELSMLAWRVLRQGIDFAVSIDDRPAVEMLRRCARGDAGDRPLAIGETGVAGLAALAEAMQDGAAARTMGLDASSRVLVFLTEGVIDVPTWERLAGSSFDSIASEA